MRVQPAARSARLPRLMAAAIERAFLKRPRLASQMTRRATRRMPPEARSHWMERGSRRVSGMERFGGFGFAWSRVRGGGVGWGEDWVRGRAEDFVRRWSGRGNWRRVSPRMRSDGERRRLGCAAVL